MNWTPDVPLTLETAADLVRSQFPQFKSFQPLGQGWDNLAILADQTTVFRLPTREMGGHIVKYEINVLPVIHPHLPEPTPDFQYIGNPSNAYPYHFVGYPLIPGQTADSRTWTNDQRSALTERLALFLKSLHSLDPIQIGLTNLPGDEIHRKDPVSVFNKLTNHATSIDWTQLPLDFTPIHDWVNKTAHSITVTNKSAVIHGDLYPRHLMVDNQHNLTGIIDWGDVHRGHPAVDLSLAYTFIPAEDRSRFFQLYNHPVEDSDKLLAQIRATMYGVALTRYGQSVNDQNAQNLGVQILQNLPLDD